MNHMQYQKNRIPFKEREEVNQGESLTIPDQTMTLKTLLERHARGLPVTGVSSEARYDGEDSLGIDPRELDMVEIQEIVERGKAAKNKVEEIRKTPVKKKEVPGKEIKPEDGKKDEKDEESTNIS